MLNKEKHQLIMGKILRDVYGTATIASLLGFKGGTCAYFFYGLSRFSVDLDFDLLEPDDENKQKLILETVGSILQKYGKVKESWIKLHTIFFLLSYGDDDHNIKFEVNIRRLVPDIRAHYELKEYLGISMLVGKKDYLFASKLAALTGRRKTAMRDIYDIWYFANNNWDLEAELLETRTSKNIKDYLTDCIAVIEQVKDNEILQGLGELINGSQKDWARTKLRTDTIFLLKNYRSVLK